MLGKRVDYSGRSIITVGPSLNLNECGLPIYIAVKMFTPFIIGKLIEKKIVYTPKQAEKLIKEGNPIALKFLEEVIKDKYVLLNRAPTLHRLSIEAFKIKLMPGKKSDFILLCVLRLMPTSMETRWRFICLSQMKLRKRQEN